MGYFCFIFYPKSMFLQANFKLFYAFKQRVKIQLANC